MNKLNSVVLLVINENIMNITHCIMLVKKCANKRNAQYYQTHTEKIIAKSKSYQQNNKTKLTRHKETVNSNKNDIEMLNIKVEQLTNTLEMLKTFTSVA